jgi:hypothetical protein
MKKIIVMISLLLAFTAAVFCAEADEITGQVQDATSFMGSKAKQDSLLGGFTPGVIIAGIIFGTFGLYAFGRGKKRQNFWLMIIGVALMVFPYFVRETLPTIIVGSLLCVAFYYKRN